MQRALAALMMVGCSADFAPQSVSSPWVAHTLDKNPDVVVAVDVAALNRDPFFAKVVDLAKQDIPAAYDALLSSSYVDVFGTVARDVTAVVYGGGPLPPALVTCVTRDTKLSVSTSGAAWVASLHATTGDVPAPVSVEDGAILEAWVGPGALDEGLHRAIWSDGDLWRHLYAVRFLVLGGATPGMAVDARFETADDAEHAEYDLERIERMVRRSAEAGADDQVRTLVASELPKIHVARSGRDLTVRYRASPELTSFLVTALDKQYRTGHTRPTCD